MWEAVLLFPHSAAPRSGRAWKSFFLLTKTAAGGCRRRVLAVGLARRLALNETASRPTARRDRELRGTRGTATVC